MPIPTLQRPALVFALFAGLFGFAVAAFAPQIFHDGDTYWHLTAGAWMLKHHAVLNADVFSFTVAGQPWHTQEWLSEVLMALAFRNGAWNGLHLLFGAAMGVTAILVAGAVRARTDFVPALLISVMGLACILGSLLARPHMLALPLVALWTMGLLQARGENRSPGWWLLGVLVLWANLHGSFAFGLALACGFAVEAVIADRAALKEWSKFLVAATLSALVTPHGLNGLLFPFQLLLLGSIHNIGEWARTDLIHPGPFVIALLVLVGAVVTKRLKLPWMRALMLAGLSFLALAHVRHQMLFGIVGALLVADALGSQQAGGKAAPRWLAPLAAGLLVVMIAARFAFPATRGDDAVTPRTALAQVRFDLRDQPVFNAYDFGGYLIFMGVLDYVDGRTDMYGDNFLAEYDRLMRPDVPLLKETLARWHIAWTILPPGPVAQAMDKVPGWHRGYSDGVAVIHIRDDYWPPG